MSDNNEEAQVPTGEEFKPKAPANEQIESSGVRLLSPSIESYADPFGSINPARSLANPSSIFRLCPQVQRRQTLHSSPKSIPRLRQQMQKQRKTPRRRAHSCTICCKGRCNKFKEESGRV